MMPALYRAASVVFALALLGWPEQAQETDCASRTLPISVRDAQGAPIHGFQSPDFEAKLQRKPVQILSITPDKRQHRVVVLLDTSGSMAGEATQLRPWEAATIVALHLAATRGSKIPLSLILFGETADVAVDFSRGSPAVKSKLEEMLKDADVAKKQIRGRTALYDAIAKGFRLLDHPTSADVLYVVSDAGDNLSHKHPRDIERMLASSGVRIFAVIVRDVGLLYTPEELAGFEDLAGLIEKTGGMTVGLVRASGAWSIVGEGTRGNWQEAMQHFYQSLLGNDLIRIQVPPDLHRCARLQIKLSDAAQKDWKGAQVLVPSEIGPCVAAESH